MTVAQSEAVEAFRPITGITPDADRMLRHSASMGAADRAFGS